MEAKQFEDGKKMKGITPDGDHVYYVAHKENQELRFNDTHNAAYNSDGNNPNNIKVPDPIY